MCCRCTIGRPPRPGLTVTCSGMPNLLFNALTSWSTSAAAAQRTADCRCTLTAALLAARLLLMKRSAADAVRRQDCGLYAP